MGSRTAAPSAGRTRSSRTNSSTWLAMISGTRNVIKRLSGRWKSGRMDEGSRVALHSRVRDDHQDVDEADDVPRQVEPPGGRIPGRDRQQGYRQGGHKDVAPTRRQGEPRREVAAGAEDEERGAGDEAREVQRDDGPQVDRHQPRAKARQLDAEQDQDAGDREEDDLRRRRAKPGDQPARADEIATTNQTPAIARTVAVRAGRASSSVGMRSAFDCASAPDARV